MVGQTTRPLLLEGGIHSKRLLQLDTTDRPEAAYLCPEPVEFRPDDMQTLCSLAFTRWVFSQPGLEDLALLAESFNSLEQGLLPGATFQRGSDDEFFVRTRLSSRYCRTHYKPLFLL